MSQQPVIQVHTVAAALAIHPFTLSKWRKDAKNGRLRGRASQAARTSPRLVIRPRIRRSPELYSLGTMPR